MDDLYYFVNNINSLWVKLGNKVTRFQKKVTNNKKKDKQKTIKRIKKEEIHIRDKKIQE